MWQADIDYNNDISGHCIAVNMGRGRIVLITRIVGCVATSPVILLVLVISAVRSDKFVMVLGTYYFSFLR